MYNIENNYSYLKLNYRLIYQFMWILKSVFVPFQVNETTCQEHFVRYRYPAPSAIRLALIYSKPLRSNVTLHRFCLVCHPLHLRQQLFTWGGGRFGLGRDLPLKITKLIHTCAFFFKEWPNHISIWSSKFFSKFCKRAKWPNWYTKFCIL